MKRLLMLEYHKNFAYKPFIIYSILYFVSLVGVLYVGFNDIDLWGIRTSLKEQGIYDFPVIWNFTTYIADFLRIILGLVIVFSICQEFTNRTFHQNIIDGLSRKDFIMSKMLIISLFSLIATILVVVFSIVIGIKNSEEIDLKLAFSEIYFAFNFFVKLLVFLTFLMFLSVLIRKSMLVILAIFGWFMIETIFKLVEWSDTKTADNAGLTDVNHYSQYLPLESMSNLIPNPFVRLKFMENFTGGMLPKAPEYPTEALIVSVLWGIVFILGTYAILKKRDWSY